MPPELVPFFIAVMLVLVAWLLFLFISWNMNELKHVDALQDMVAEWQDVTLGDVETFDGILNHLKKEVDEIRGQPGDVSKFADAYILLNVAAKKAGHSMSSVLSASVTKHKINLKRDWGPPNEDGFSEHIKR